MLQSWECAKLYRLDPKRKDDLNYLHSDGKLYMVDKDPYDQNHYCLENINTASGTIEVRLFLHKILKIFGIEMMNEIEASIIV